MLLVALFTAGFVIIGLLAGFLVVVLGRVIRAVYLLVMASGRCLCLPILGVVGVLLRCSLVGRDCIAANEGSQ